MIAMLSLEEEPEFRRALANSDVELLVYAGELDMHHDSARELCESLERGHFLSIAGRSHGNASEPQEFLVTEIVNFLEANSEKT